MINYNADRRCSDCKKKETGCSTWRDSKEEKTVSGWDKNRFATSCREFEGKKEEEEK